MRILNFTRLHLNKSTLFELTFAVMLVLCLLAASNAQDLSHDSPKVVRVPSAVVKIADSVNVPAEYAGVLNRVFVKEGQLVLEGQAIAKINDDELRLRLTKAKYENDIAKMNAKNDVDIRYSEKSRDVAAADVQRSKRANSKVVNSVPAARLNRQILEEDRTILQLEQAKRDFAIAQLKTSLTETEMQLSEVLLGKTEIRSPMNGMIVSVERKQGEWVQPSETIVKIVRIDRLRIEGFVPAAEASRIKIGAPVEVKFSQDWLKGRTYRGSVVFVSPEANPVNSEILIWAEIHNENNDLLPGLRGEIVIRPESTLQSASRGEPHGG